jgi:hypothetical protein
MTEYFALIDEDRLRRGPFATMQDAVIFLKETSRDRGYTDEKAQQFYLHETAIVKVDPGTGHEDVFNLSWLARELSLSGRQKLGSEEFTRKRERFANAKKQLCELRIVH